MTEMLELPTWFEEDSDWDVEQILIDYFSWLLGDKVFVCTWMAPGYYQLSSGEAAGGTQPTLRIWRQPGRFDPTLRWDQALVQIAAITPTRSESWRLIKFVRRMLDDEVFTKFPILRADGSVSTFTHSEEWVGPQLVPERVVDEKFIPITFKLSTRERIDQPNYRQVLKSLPH